MCPWDLTIPGKEKRIAAFPRRPASIPAKWPSRSKEVDLAPLVLAPEQLDALRRAERLIAHDLDTEGIPL